MQRYVTNKKIYLGLKHHSMSGGSNKFKVTKVICYVNKKNDKNNDNIFHEISTIAKKDINTLKKISLDDLCGLVLRVYERNGEKTINPIVFRTSNIIKYLDSIDPQECSGNQCTINIDSFKYTDYYDKNFGNITTNKLNDLILDFGTSDTNIKLAFYDNYMGGIKEHFEIQQPIRLVDFIEKTFDHFDKVKLIGYPDNGGIDAIKYDKKHDIYMIYTWS